MNPATRPTSGRTRDRAVDRIRELTVGTAIVGFAATGAFGVLAAVTYAGTTTTGNDAGAVSNDLPINLGGSSDTSGATSNGGTATPAPFQVVQAPTRTTTHPAHVTSGGSGG
jgi:hypothetical protein